MYYGCGNFFGLGILGPIFMVMFWVFVVFLMLSLLKKTKWHTEENQSYWSEKENALNILKQRYAKGEIDKKEFEEKKKDLTD